MAYFINWDKIPEGYDWVAVDKNGDAWIYVDKPYYSEIGDHWISGGVKKIIWVIGSEHKDWRELLFHRHESQKTY